MTAILITEALAQMGEAGARLDEIQSCEAGAGNISFALRECCGLDEAFPNQEAYTLPAAVASLAGWTVLVTGSGRRLRDIGRDPGAAVAAVTVGADGSSGTLRFADTRAWKAPSSEFNSHLAVHSDQVSRNPGLTRHVVVHAQPIHLVALSHVDAFRDSRVFTKRIIRWEPETIVQLPDGLEVLDFMVPGSDTLQQGSVAGLRDHRIVVWSKHGVMVRHDTSPLGAVDLIEYAETGARYDHLNTIAGNPSEGLSDSELRAVVAAFNVQTTLV